VDRKKLISKVREIATFSNVFKVILEQNKAPYTNMESDWLQGMQFYLHGYAYERQGRSPEYSTAAVEAVKQAALASSSRPDSGFPLRAWSAFLQILRLPASGKGANPNNNPLYPSVSTTKDSITSLTLRLREYDYNLIKMILSLLQQGNIESAHTFLCQIRGTGSKINSLFLRDIVLMYDLRISQDHPLLQPVDIWVRRLTRLLMDFPPDVPKDEKDAYSDDTKIARTIIGLSKAAGVSPLTFNQGAWVFGAEIAGTKARLIQYVEDKFSPRDAVNRKARLLEEQIKALRGLTF
jgi:hypothetical protein